MGNITHVALECRVLSASGYAAALSAILQAKSLGVSVRNSEGTVLSQLLGQFIADFSSESVEHVLCINFLWGLRVSRELQCSLSSEIKIFEHVALRTRPRILSDTQSVLGF